MNKFFSLVKDPPPGFIFDVPGKRELLTGNIALFAAQLDDAFVLLPDFCNRVKGLLITQNSSFSHNELAPQLWHLTVPRQHLPFLYQFTTVSLDILEKSSQENEKNKTLISEMTYKSQILFHTQDGYNKAINRLQFMMEETRLENKKRRKMIIQLENEIRKRKKAQGERFKLEARLHQAQKMEAIGLMAGGVAHDLNNILAGVVGYPDLLLLNLPETSDLRQPLENIKASGKRAAEVVADLLTISRRAAKPNTVANLNDILCQYLDSLEFKRLKSLHPNVTYRLNLKNNLANINCSGSHIRKCLMNLIVNSSEAITGSGSLLITTEDKTFKQAGEYGNQSIKKGRYVVIRIKDSGMGIAKEHLSHIFEPFYSRKTMGRSGTGLGLTVVWNTVQEHKGIIHVDSDENGTTFELLFPATNKMMSNKLVEVSTESLSGNQEIVMVVDDETLLLDLAEIMLVKLNYRVVTMNSGEKAIDYIRDHDIDLIILDMIMDPGINGRQTYDKILTFRPDQRAIIASGFAETDDVEKMLESGASSFLPKPYTTHILGKIVKKALEKKVTGKN